MKKKLISLFVLLILVSAIFVVAQEEKALNGKGGNLV